MVRLIMLCPLIGSVAMIGICGGITFFSNAARGKPDTALTAPAILGEASADAPAAGEGGHENMGNRDMRNTFKEGIVRQSIEVMRGDGMDDEAIKKKMMESFSLDEAAANRLMDEAGRGAGRKG